MVGRTQITKKGLTGVALMGMLLFAAFALGACYAGRPDASQGSHDTVPYLAADVAIKPCVCTDSAPIVTLTDTSAQLERKLPVWVATYDSQKAFDSVPIQALPTWRKSDAMAEPDNSLHYTVAWDESNATPRAPDSFVWESSELEILWQGHNAELFYGLHR
jgi:hypothetical protein